MRPWLLKGRNPAAWTRTGGEGSLFPPSFYPSSTERRCPLSKVTKVNPTLPPSERAFFKARSCVSWFLRQKTGLTELLADFSIPRHPIVGLKKSWKGFCISVIYSTSLCAFLAFADGKEVFLRKLLFGNLRPVPLIDFTVIEVLCLCVCVGVCVFEALIFLDGRGSLFNA